MPYSFRTPKPLSIVGVALAASVASAAALAADPKSIGVHKDWEAFVYDTKDGRACYMVSRPKKSEGKYTHRDPTYVIVTHRPGENTYDVVSVIAGYTYKPDSDVTLEIDGKGFTLFTVGDAAWSLDQDKEIAAAIRRGSRMVVKGTSKRGTLTTDTYGLNGSGAAHGAITKACATPG